MSSFVFEITEHALIRYVDRVLGIGNEIRRDNDLSIEEKEELITKKSEEYLDSTGTRDNLIVTISELIMQSDLVFSDYRTNQSTGDNETYFVYKNLIFVFVGGHIRTIYKSKIKNMEEVQTLKKYIRRHRKNRPDSLNARNYATVLIGHKLLNGVFGVNTEAGGSRS